MSVQSGAALWVHKKVEKA
ncbi:hypothetical protein OIU78_001147 [Salix suchowensis]|nr:hypothetical protein OIU78_001147 [Salix suchowensis]